MGLSNDDDAMGAWSYIYFTKVQMKNRLRELRAEQGLSQAELADKLNVSRQTINAIETEKYDPSLPLAFKIAKLFDLKIEDIFSADTKSKR